MQRDIGRIDMVRWQGRRPPPEQRARTRIVQATLFAGVIAALSLMAGFYSGLPVPVSVLQSFFVLLALALLGFLAWTLTSLAAHRSDRSRISGYRRQPPL